MSRRIALWMLLTVWAMLIAGGASAYWTTRQVLLRNLDATLEARASALPGLSATPLQVPESDRWLVQNDLGQTLARPAGLPAPPPQVVSAEFTRLADGTRWRSLTLRAFARGSDGAAPKAVVVTYSTPADAFDQLMIRLALTLAGVGLAGGVLAAGVAVRVSHSALKPLRQTAQQIEQIDQRALDRRIDLQPLPVELRPMARRLNEMLGRLEEAFDRQQRFLADASHELRTPVAALLTAIEIALRYPRDAQAYREALDSCRADAAFLCQLVERLFEQVRSQLPDLEEMPEPVDVATFLGQCADTVEPLAQTAGVELQRHWVAKHGQRPWVTQRGRLRSIVVNLLNNAVEHAPAGSAVEMFCAMADDALYLAVRDQGPGIPPEHLPHVFEPFYRVDKSRSRAAGHLGLGLALVHTHVEAMRGRCQVQNAHPGTIFEVVLPMK